MNDVQHLRPVVLVNDEGPALWRLEDGPLALAIFSDVTEAEAYAREHGGEPAGAGDSAVKQQDEAASGRERPEPTALAAGPADAPKAAVESETSASDFETSDSAPSPAGPRWQVKSPDPTQTVRMLAVCLQSGICVAVLNPRHGRAQRLFGLADILRDVRARLRRGESIHF